MSLIKQLREMTGAGMLECKKALDECANDMDKAVDYLRKKGIASMSKRSENKTEQGNFGLYQDDKCVCIVGLMSETDFVANNSIFKDAADEIAKAVAKKGGDIEGLSLNDIAPQSVLDSLVQMKENIKLGKVAYMEKKDGEHIYHYIHNAGQNRVAAMVRLSGECEQGIGVAVHVACNIPTPVAIKPEDVNEDAIKEEMKFIDNPDEKKIRKDLSVLGATFLMNPSHTVTEVLGKAELLEYIRLELKD